MIIVGQWINGTVFVFMMNCRFAVSKHFFDITDNAPQVFSDCFHAGNALFTFRTVKTVFYYHWYVYKNCRNKSADEVGSFAAGRDESRRLFFIL
jgi:hypothetical protein